MNLSRLKNLKDDVNRSVIELYGDKRVLVFDCKSVVDYSDTLIVLELGGRCVKITGRNMIADSFVFGQTDITGEIYSLEFV